MPSADVTIEATFVLAEKEEEPAPEPQKEPEKEPEPKAEEEKEDNPNTAVTGLKIASIAFIVSLVIAYIYQYKLNKIK